MSKSSSSSSSSSSALSELEALLRPLIDAKKIKVNHNNIDKFSDIKDLLSSTYFGKMNSGPSKLNPTERELADFVIKNIARNFDKESPSGNNFGALDYVDLLDKKNTIKDTERQPVSAYNGQYGPKQEDSAIGLSLAQDLNPITTLMHEGVHALDDNYMRTHQKALIDFLAKHEGRAAQQVGGLDTKKLFESAQNILSTPAFNQKYPYDTFLAPKIQAAFNQLDYKAGPYGSPDVPVHPDPNNPKQVDPNKQVNSFRHAQTALQSGVAPGAFMGLSEFPGFAMENLHQPWNVPWQKKGQNDVGHKKIYFNVAKGVGGQLIPHPRASLGVLETTNPDINLGRKFLRRMTKDVYGHFNTLDPNFASTYPNANKAFMDRLMDLRNQNKYPNSNDYMAHLATRGTPSSSSSSSSSSLPSHPHLAVANGMRNHMASLAASNSPSSSSSSSSSAAAYPAGYSSMRSFPSSSSSSSMQPMNSSTSTLPSMINPSMTTTTTPSMPTTYYNPLTSQMLPQSSSKNDVID